MMNNQRILGNQHAQEKKLQPINIELRPQNQSFEHGSFGTHTHTYTEIHIDSLTKTASTMWNTKINKNMLSLVEFHR